MQYSVTMDGNTTTQFTDAEEFKQAVDEADDDVLTSANPLKGAPMGCTVGTLFGCASTYDDPLIITSALVSAPIPLGATFTVDNLDDVVDLVRTLGTSCLEGFRKQDGGSVEIEYHFD